MPVVNADYETVVAACRRCIAYGTQLSGYELTQVIDVVQDAVARQAAAEAQIVLLQAIDATMEGAAMNTAVDTADTAIVAAATLTSNSLADG